MSGEREALAAAEDCEGDWNGTQCDECRKTAANLRADGYTRPEANPAPDVECQWVINELTAQRNEARAEVERLAVELRLRGDQRPETAGIAHQHDCGRVCQRRAGAREWWPAIWEDGMPNLSAGSFCLKPHPMAALDDEATR